MAFKVVRLSDPDKVPAKRIRGDEIFADKIFYVNIYDCDFMTIPFRTVPLINGRMPPSASLQTIGLQSRKRIVSRIAVLKS